MTAPHLPEVVRHAARLSTEIPRASPGALWVVRGHATAGKTALLHRVAAHLEAPDPSRTQTFWPILVAPPLGAFDSGPSALLEIGAELRRRGAINGQLEATVLNPRVAWSSKLREVRSWLEAHQDRVVLLCDEPLGWRARPSEDAHFAARTRDVVEILLSSPCRKIVAGSIPQNLRPDETIELRPASDPDSWLSDDAEWGLLAPAARELYQALGARLAGYSPLEIRLMVALVALGSVTEIQAWLSIPGSRRDLSRRVAEKLSGRRDLKPLTLVWARLALLRRPFPDSALEVTGAGALPDLGQAILRRCLLYREADAWVLHDTLKADAREHQWLSVPETESVHRELAQWYAGRFSERLAATEPRSALVAELEAFHHSAAGQDASAHQRLRVFFVDQLDLLGRELSLNARRTGNANGFEQAAQVFERALGWDDQDDYAHHYFAFNLDVLGRDADRVEKHYQQAIRLQPWGPWWHSRYITFLITRSRMTEARAAWARALDIFRLPDEYADAEIYSDLHVWVARLLLHRGQLDFAEEVMRGIPERVREDDPRLQAIARRLNAFLEARRVGAFVPGPHLRTRWWEDGPFLLDATEHNRKLSRWMAARLDAIEGKTIHLRIATIEAAGKEPTYEDLELPFATLQRWLGSRARSISAGQFLEIGVYGSAKDPHDWVVKLHKQRPWEDLDLPPLFPDPNRYLMRWSRTGQ